MSWLPQRWQTRHFQLFEAKNLSLFTALDTLFLWLLVVNTDCNHLGNSWRGAIVEHRYFEYFSSVLQCANLLLTDSSKGGNALTTRATDAFSNDFVVRMMTRQNLSTRNHFKCEQFFSSTKILSSVTKLQRDRRVALEAYNFLSSEKIYCSMTATLQRIIIFCNRYHTKWYCVSDRKLLNEYLPILKCLRKKASGKLRWCMWISNQDSTGRGNVQYGWKRRRRRRLLSSWVKVSINLKSRILPNKTRSNCWLATIRFCMASKQQRRAIKTFRGSILIGLCAV